MTATLIAMLVEDGTLRWDQTLAESLPDLASRMHADYRGVTLEQLLSHRAGVPSDLSADGLWGRLWADDGKPNEARRMLVEGVLTRAPEHAPGTKCLYANAGYAIAGYIAETKLETTFEVLLRKRLFEPLGMRSAGFGAPGSNAHVDSPRGHRRDGDKFAPVAPGRGADNPPAIAPAGTVHAALGDWAKFVALHLRGYADGRRMLSDATLKKLHTPPDDLNPYALGWAAMQRSWGGNVITHSGSNTMWYCVVWASPERGFAVLVATNAAGEDAAKACDEAAAALIQRHTK